MNNEFFVGHSSFKSILAIAVITYIYSWSLTWAIGNKRIHGAESFCMVYLSKPIAFVLFLRFFKRKVSLWPILMQVINLITFMASIIIYSGHPPSFNDANMNRVFGWIYAINICSLTVIIIIDILLYVCMHKKHDKK